MVVAGTVTAYGSNTINDAKDKRDEAQKKLDEVNKQISEINEAQDALQAEMEAYDEALMAVLTDLTLLEEDITHKQAEIDQAKVDLAIAEEKEANQYAAMKIRIQYMYENSDNSVWSMLTDSGNMSDALNRMEYINDVYDYDRDQLTEYQETVQEVVDLSVKLDNEMIELAELQVNMEEQQAELETIIAESESKMEDIETQLASAEKLAKSYAKTIKKQNQIISDEEARIAAANAAANAGGGSGITGNANPSYSTNVSGQDVVNYACQFVGNPYVFGGTSLTNGCDCSYFVMACYGNFGISLPRTSYLQRSSGQAVSYSNAKAGDIICYAGHVAIYMGDGKIVHAANEKKGICYGNATYRTILSVRRVL